MQVMPLASIKHSKVLHHSWTDDPLGQSLQLSENSNFDCLSYSKSQKKNELLNAPHCDHPWAAAVLAFGDHCSRWVGWNAQDMKTMWNWLQVVGLWQWRDNVMCNDAQWGPVLCSPSHIFSHLERERGRRRNSIWNLKYFQPNWQTLAIALQHQISTKLLSKTRSKTSNVERLSSRAVRDSHNTT